MTPLNTLRQVGPHPIRLAVFVSYRLRALRRHRSLRGDYPRQVGQPPSGAHLTVPVVELGRAADLPGELREPARRLRDEAAEVARHQVDYLGSGPVDLGPEIDWHRDFKSGYRWPETFYMDLEVTRLDDDSDAKVPWELSRGHQLLTLARTAVLFEDEPAARELEAQLSSWMEANPPGVGINWVNAMETSLRAVNWLWAIGTLETWRPLDPALRADVTRSLQSHARHVVRNLEGSPLLRSNHYMADILGLFALGLSIEGDPEAGRWERTGRRALEREVQAQVHPDGANFEASLPYHGLVLEMLLVAWDLGVRSGRPLSDAFRRRLVEMLEVSRSVRHPGGRTPIFGDQDSGRVLPAGYARPATQDNLVGMGAAALGERGPAHEEVAWNQGVGAWRELAARGTDQRPPTTTFPDGGFYVLSGAGTHLLARWGDVGQKGNGGHGHNDLGSFELSVDGEVFVVDSGTYVYTSDLAARNEFRAARAHNVLVLDGLDPHPVPAEAAFKLPAFARFRVEEWVEGRRLVAGHDGFARQGAGEWYRREISLDPESGELEISDTVEGTGSEHSLESFLHLAPGTTVRETGEGSFTALKAGRRVTIRFHGADAVQIDRGWASESFGSREEAPVLKATSRSSLPACLAYRIAAVEAE